MLDWPTVRMPTSAKAYSIWTEEQARRRTARAAVCSARPWLRTAILRRHGQPAVLSMFSVEGGT